MLASASPRAQLLERNAGRWQFPHTLIVGWSATDLAHLHRSGCVPEGATASCFHFGEYEHVRHDTSLGLRTVSFGLPESANPPIDLAIMDLPQGREAREMLFHRTAALLAENGRMLVVGETRAGIKPAKKALSALFESVETVDNARRCALILAEGKCSSVDLSAAIDSWFEVSDVSVNEMTARIWSLPGVFSHGHLDDGTRLLLETLSDDPAERVLDMCCGSGVIATLLHRQRIDRQIDMVDCDALALSAAKRTASENGIPEESAFASDVFSHVSNQYELIVSNPPFHRGITTDHGVGEQLVAGAADHLEPGGRLRFVANAFLPYPRLMDAHFSKWKTIEDDGRYRIYEAKSRKQSL